MANRFRKNKTIRVGDRVLLKDPRQQRAGGRTPYKRTPYSIKEVHGNKATVTLADGSELTDIHVENMLQAPDDAVNLENKREPLEFQESESFLLDDINQQCSLGEMLEDDGNLRDEHLPDVKKNKADKVSAGTIIAYAIDKQSYSIAKVLNVSEVELESRVLVHRYSPTSDGRLRIQWKPLFLEPDGTEGFHGSEPVKITLISRTS